MIKRLTSYSSEKESGLPWLGKIPNHWELMRLGALVRERGETNEKGSVTDVLSVTRDRGVIPYAEKGNIGNKKSEDITRYKIVRPNDIVVNCMNVIIGSVGISNYTGCLSPVYYVLVTRHGKDNPRYLNAYFQTKPFQESLVRIGNGILAHRMRIPMELLKCELFPRPPQEEQLGIVRFLDYTEQLIRRHVRAKQKLIKLLEAQKQAVIQQAVTRGLIPNLRLKPSGVPWLGDIPEHWKVMKLHHLTNPKRPIMYGIVLPGPNVDDGVLIVKGGNCEPGRLRKELLSRTSYEIEASYKRSRLLPADIVFAIRGGVGAAEMVPPDLEGANLTQDAARISPRDGVRPLWLLFAVRSHYFQAHAEARILGATVRGINICDLKRIELAVPPTQEQGAIAKYLDEATAGITVAAAEASKEIELLREYRTSVMTGVVTGKLDVRAASKALPEEIRSIPDAEQEDIAEERGEVVESDIEGTTEEAEA